MTSSNLTKKFSSLKASHYLWLALFVFMLFLPSRASLPPLDRDEARYMQATSQMLESHNFIDVRFQDKPRYLQPAGIYWLEAIAVKITGTEKTKALWPYRIPSLLAATGSVLLTAWIGNLLFDSLVGFLGGVLLAFSVLLAAEGRMATIDTTLLFFILLAQSSLVRAWLNRFQKICLPISVALIFWIAIGCGLMLKGPVILIPTLSTLFALSIIDRNKRWWQHLRLNWGWLISLLIVLPWCIAIGVVSHGQFFSNSVGTNFLGKVASGQQAHGLPPGYYILIFLISFWPGSVFTAWALPFFWKERKSESGKFLLCWIIPHWLVFEAIATKLPHYVLPTYPAIAIFTAAAVVKISNEWKGPTANWGKILLWVYIFLWALAGIALSVGGIWIYHRFTGKISLPALATGVGVIILINLVIFCLFKNKIQKAVLAAIATAIVVYLELFTILIPDMRNVWLSQKVAHMVDALKPCQNSIVASASYSEPSLVFLLGKDTHLINPAETAKFLQENKACGLGLVDKRDQDSFFKYLKEENLVVKRLGHVSGINYSNGKRLDLSLFQVDNQLNP